MSGIRVPQARQGFYDSITSGRVYSSIDFWFIDDRQKQEVIIALGTNSRHQPKSFVGVAFDALVDGPLGGVNFRKRTHDQSYWYAARFSS